MTIINKPYHTRKSDDYYFSTKTQVCADIIGIFLVDFASAWATHTKAKSV